MTYQEWLRAQCENLADQMEAICLSYKAGYVSMRQARRQLSRYVWAMMAYYNGAYRGGSSC